MQINNTDIKLYNADLLGYDLGCSNVTNNSYTPLNSLPVFYYSEIKEKPLTIRLVVQGSDREDLNKNISRLFAVCHSNPTITIKDNLFECIYTSSTVSAMGTSATKLNLTFTAIHKGQEQRTELTQSTTVINNIGTRECPYIAEITPTEDMEAFTINDITIRDLKADQTIIINGLKKTVTMNGINKFNDTDLITFPLLSIGENTIKVSDTQPTITVKSNPIFI